MKEYAELHWVRTCYACADNHDRLVMLRAERAYGKITFTQARPDSPTFIKDARNGVPVVASMSTRESFTRWLEAPFKTLRKAVKVLPTLLDIQLPFPLEDCVYMFVAGRRPENNSTAGLAVGARIANVRKKIARFEAMKINPVVLDQDGLAIWTQSLRELPATEGDKKKPRVIMYLNGIFSTLVLGRGDDFLSAHSVNADDPGSIKRLLNAQLGNPSEVHWIWTGPDAGDQERVTDIHAMLANDWPGHSDFHDDPGTFLVRAIAVRALLPGPMRCNLRMGQLAHPAILQKGRTREVKAAVVCLLAGLILCGVNVLAQNLVKNRQDDMNRALGAMADGLAGYHVAEKGDDALKTLNGLLENRMKLCQPFLDSVENQSVIGIITGMVKAGDANGLRYETLSAGWREVIVVGTAPDAASCEKLISYIKQEGFSAELEKKDSLPDTRIPFTLTCRRLQ